MTTFKYIVVGESMIHAREFDYPWEGDQHHHLDMIDHHLDMIAAEAAEYHHDNCDGVHDNWPLMIEIFSMDDESLGVFEVEREFDASFYPTKQ